MLRYHPLSGVQITLYSNHTVQPRYCSFSRHVFIHFAQTDWRLSSPGEAEWQSGSAGCFSSAKLSIPALLFTRRDPLFHHWTVILPCPAVEPLSAGNQMIHFLCVFFGTPTAVSNFFTAHTAVIWASPISSFLPCCVELFSSLAPEDELN